MSDPIQIQGTEPDDKFYRILTNIRYGYESWKACPRTERGDTAFLEGLVTALEGVKNV